MWSSARGCAARRCASTSSRAASASASASASPAAGASGESIEAARARSFIKGKSGFDAGFLPAGSNAVRPPRRFPSPELTAAAPKPRASTSGDESPSGSESASALGRWRAEMSDRRRNYMATHLTKRIEQAPTRTASRRAKQEEGARQRDAALNAPKSEAELLSMPTIDAALLADLAPTSSTAAAGGAAEAGTEARLAQRRANRAEHDAVRREDKLHALLEIHHRAGRYATDVVSLDKMLTTAFQPILSYNAAPTHTLKQLVDDNNGARAREAAARLADAQNGTAAGGLPGVVEVGAILEGKATQS